MAVRLFPSFFVLETPGAIPGNTVELIPTKGGYSVARVIDTRCVDYWVTPTIDTTINTRWCTDNTLLAAKHPDRLQTLQIIQVLVTRGSEALAVQVKHCMPKRDPGRCCSIL